MWRLLLGTMGVKSLVQGLNTAATAGFEPRTVWSEVRRRNRLATVSPDVVSFMFIRSKRKRELDETNKGKTHIMARESLLASSVTHGGKLFRQKLSWHQITSSTSPSEASLLLSLQPPQENFFARLSAWAREHMYEVPIATNNPAKKQVEDPMVPVCSLTCACRLR